MSYLPTAPWDIVLIAAIIVTDEVVKGAAHVEAVLPVLSVLAEANAVACKGEVGVWVDAWHVVSHRGDYGTASLILDACVNESAAALCAHACSSAA